jgi:carbohydrate-binding DOMON domain-containing protein
MGNEAICIDCGTTFDAPAAETSCPACTASKPKAPRALIPLALYAAIAAAFALGIGYSTLTETTAHSSLTRTTTRILIFSSSSESSFSSTINGEQDTGPVVRHYRDPLALAGGGAAIVLGLAAVVVAARKREQRSLMFAGAAAAIGVYKVLQGAGMI